MYKKEHTTNMSVYFQRSNIRSNVSSNVSSENIEDLNLYKIWTYLESKFGIKFDIL